MSRTVDNQTSAHSPAQPAGAAPPPPPVRRRGVLAGMRIRKKMIVLHTTFSLAMTLILLVTLRPALLRVVSRAEEQEAARLLELTLRTSPRAIAPAGELLIDGEQVRIRRGVDPRTVPADWVERARAVPGTAHIVPGRALPGVATAWTELDGIGELWIVETSIETSRRAVLSVYGLAVLALLFVYALVAGALELFVLPQHVYGPISRILDADLALTDGRTSEELVPDEAITHDELGEIMRSRNETIRRIRRHERALAEALAQIELVAADLKRKNHLLETARRNLAGADRLVSLGIMAAGIAHELNTPLAVAKGLVEKLDTEPSRSLSQTEAALLRRVIGRLERLSEGLLDFARVRPPESSPVALRDVAIEAMELLRLDRGSTRAQILNDIPADLIVEADGDRLVQVMVNLVRNAIDAISRTDHPGVVSIEAETIERDGSAWALVTITDDGPGIDPEVLLHLFEPFVSSHLDDRGTGLGLAVSEGIVREHGGTLLARNRTGRSGAVFEVMLPIRSTAPLPLETP